MKHLALLWNRVPEGTRAVCAAAAQAAVAALSAVAFLVLSNLLFSSVYGRLATLGPVWFLCGSLTTVGCTSLLVGLLLFRFSPEAAGSGIPQLKAAYWKDLGSIPLAPVIVKFVGGILSLGGGTSLGREGPTVYVSGGLASNLSGWLGTARQRRRAPAVTGAAAGLAAAFNTPLAAISFVLEEILGELSNKLIGVVVVASVVGALVVHALIGPQPAFTLPRIDAVSWQTYLVVPIVAAGASLVGVAFRATTLFLRARIRGGWRLPRWLGPLCGGLVTWGIGSAVFLCTGRVGVFGLGYGDLSSALGGSVVWWIAGVLVAAKFVATVFSYAFGGCGGIFSPTLFLGGLTGIFLGGAAATWLPLGHADMIILGAVGMAACFNCVVRAPLTALLMVFEMTHEFSLVPALMIAVVVSQAVARFGGKHNFYDGLLLQDGHELIRIKPPRNLESWLDVSIGEIARARPVVLTDLSPRAVREVLERHPFERFPVSRGGRITGIVTRRDLQEALRGGREPSGEPLAECSPTTSVRRAAELLVGSSSGMLLVREPASSDVGVVVTLHDLVRAQAELCG